MGVIVEVSLELGDTTGASSGKRVEELEPGRRISDARPEKREPWTWATVAGITGSEACRKGAAARADAIEGTTASEIDTRLEADDPAMDMQRLVEDDPAMDIRRLVEDDPAMDMRRLVEDDPAGGPNPVLVIAHHFSLTPARSK